MGSSGGSGDNTVRYAAYWEAAHKDMLNKGGADTVVTSIVAAFNTAFSKNAFEDAVEIDVTGGIFGTGYEVASFPSLFDMFGKFMAGLDVHVLWETTFAGVLDSPEINAAIVAHGDYIDDEIEATIIPRFQAGMRNINAVNSTGFMMGRAVIEDARIKAVNKFASELRIRAMDLATDMWKSHLKWNESVMGMYSNIHKLYYSLEMDVNAQTMDMKNRENTYELGLYEYLRALMGVVSGAQGTVPTQEPSQAAKAISGALGGAAMGASVTGGSPIGAAIGGVVGLAASFL